jgi:hypothetical protein
MATATATRKVRIVKKGAKSFPLNVPVNIKVQGERSMRKNVILTHGPTKGLVAVRTGRRGRPAHLDVAMIERVRAL